MNKTRIVLLGVGAVLVAVWESSAPLRSARSSADAPQVEPRPEIPAAKPLFDVSKVAERLRELRAAAPSPRGDRNPFEFNTPAARPATAPRAAAAPAVESAPAAAPVPILTLSGIAENKVGDALVRTAVVSGLGQLFFVKAGDKIGSRFEVTAIGADAVEVRDLTDGRAYRLGLR
jgi:hypothetical protein